MEVNRNSGEAINKALEKNYNGELTRKEKRAIERAALKMSGVKRKYQ